MKAKFIFLLLCLCSIFSFTTAKYQQTENKKLTGYYKTYEDYVNNKLIKEDELHDYLYIMNKITIVFKKDGNKEKIKCADMWGFLFKGALFRVDHKLEHPARVMSTGKIVYYHNGCGEIEILKGRTYGDIFSIGFNGYLSNSIESEMIALPYEGIISSVRKEYNEYKKANPQHDALFECIDRKSEENEQAMNCAKSYNGK